MVTRERFNAEQAPRLAKAAGLRGDLTAGVSKRFAWVHGERELGIVAGPSERMHCDLALAYGLRESESRRLKLVLPRAHAGATLQRLAWIEPVGGVEVWVYDDVNGEPTRVPRPARNEAKSRFVEWLGPVAHEKEEQHERLDGEFRKATLPLHLRDRAAWVAELVDRVAARDDLDPAHRRGERAWHCCGQKVLRLTGVSKPSRGVRVEAGIQRDDLRVSEIVHGPVSGDQLARFLGAIERGIELRLSSGAEFHRFDEHWLQSVLRRDPHLVGIESPALREVPAWRPTGSWESNASGAWGRGYIDLLGVDAHGAVRIVETKLATNNDPLFVLQGLDYLAYCEAYRKPITRRLDVIEQAPFAITYVLGAPTKRDLKLSRFAPAQLQALADDVDHQLLTLTGWTKPPRRSREARAADVDATQLDRITSGRD